jgi:hypothetical protein
MFVLLFLVVTPVISHISINLNMLTDAFFFSLHSSEKKYYILCIDPRSFTKIIVCQSLMEEKKIYIDE